jgi:hypothetical protein
LIEANDRAGVMVEFLRKGSAGVVVEQNIFQYNNGYGVESYAAGIKATNNTSKGNGNNVAQQKISAEKFINNVP